MVERIEDTCIRIRSEMNEWMDCIFIVSEEDAARARKFCRKHGIVTGKTVMAGVMETIWKIS